MGSIHFISGMPRSGSTLLCALLRQQLGPYAAGMQSHRGAVFEALLHTMSGANEGTCEYNQEQYDYENWILRAAVTYHCAGRYFDNNRVWANHANKILSLFPNSRMLVCVRNVAWVLESIERYLESQDHMPSALFNYDASLSVYERANILLAPRGLVGFGYAAARSAFYSKHADRIAFVPYDSLARRPTETITGIMDFIGEKFDAAAHDITKIEQLPWYAEMDARAGTPGLHLLRPGVGPIERDPLLPLDLFQQHYQSEFWAQEALNTKGVKVF